MISSLSLKLNFVYQHNHCNSYKKITNVAFCSLNLFIHEILQIFQNVGFGNKLHTVYINHIVIFISTCIPVMRYVTGNFINGNLKLNRFFSPNFLKKKIKNFKSTVTKNGK